MFEAALSTMWGIGRFQNLDGFFTAARALGFRHFELNHAVNSAMIGGVSLDGLCISSIHEPCPADVSISALKNRNHLVSAPNEEDRQRAVAAVKRSIELAHRLGAQVVIVHPGRVDICPELERAVIDLYKQGRAVETEYSLAKARLVSARAAQAQINLRSARRSLAELAEHSARLGIRLGLENRYYYHEIPLPDELDELLGTDGGDTLGYWHDVGHAQALENLGFGRHEDWLRRFAPRMLGVHLHDIVGVQDHLAAGLGHMDWDMVARYLPGAALRTCEFQAFNSPQEVAAGVRLLIEMGCVVEP